jgi:methionyl-tRNA formyltransferase
MQKLKTVFMGTPDISVPVLQMLSQHEAIELVSVVSMPDRPAGRGKKLKSPEVIEYCKTKDISFFQTGNINKEVEFLASIQSTDLIIVFAFAQFLGTKILNLPRIGCFNIHTSLLPRYRGLLLYNMLY